MLLRRFLILAVLLATAASPAALAQPASKSLRDQIATNGARGTIVEATSGQFVFRPRGATGQSIKITDAKKVPPLAVGVDVVVKGALDASGQTLDLRSAQIALPNPARVTSASPSKALTDARKILETLTTDLNQQTQPGAMSVADTETSIAKMKKARRELISKCVQAREDGDSAADRKKILVAAAEVNGREVQLKTRYGLNDNYAAWTYERIYQNARNVVAIAESAASEPHCSGILVAPDLVLTAAHCLARAPPSQLSVWFDYWEMSDGERQQTMPFKAYPVKELVAPEAERQPEFFKRVQEASGGARYKGFDENFLDYAILRFEPQAGSQPQRGQQACLDGRPRLKRETAVYVIGYPSSRRIRVHDAARIYLPLYASKKEINEYACEIEADFKDDTPENVAGLVKEFLGSYASAPGTPLATAGYDQLFRDGQMGRQPVVGIVADTAGGSSGGGLYDRESASQCAIGLFIGGGPDAMSIEAASWKVFERALPMCSILADLKSRPATQAIFEKLKVVSPESDPKTCR